MLENKGKFQLRSKTDGIVKLWQDAADGKRRCDALVSRWQMELYATLRSISPVEGGMNGVGD